uniref:Putative complex I intermediate-associated protein 30, mitochondrial n=1 Tax=Aceria tosichella TaxID=561515 RepID=A0A6G1S6Q1_9ACAR
MFTNRCSIISSVLKTPKLQPQYLQIRTAFFNKYKHGPHKSNNPNMDYKFWLKELFSEEGIEDSKKALKVMARKPFKIDFTKQIPPDKTEIFEDFDSDESIKRWKPVADSDSLHGFSTANFSRSPAGHGLFHGVIDNTLPDDGMTENSGFAAIIGPPAPQEWIFKLDNTWDWRNYNCLELKYRGDGRKYFVVLNTADDSNDLSYYDNYSYPLYTRGGPYWQTWRIPFSKFLYNYKSFTQDRQGYLPAWKIKFVSIALHDKIDGPYSLEIDYIGLRNESRAFKEITPYESYKFGHIKNRPLQVESQAPERE